MLSWCPLLTLSCLFMPAVWEVFAAAHPWKGMTMGEVMTAVMIEGRRLIWGPGVPKVRREGGGLPNTYNVTG